MLLRIGLVLVVGLLLLAGLLIIAPFLLIGALLVRLLAWKRPGVVEPVNSSPRLRRMPEPARATPMRFAATLVAGSLLLSVASVAVGGSRQTDVSAEGPSKAAKASATPAPTATPTPTTRSTPRATATAKPSVRATPNPTPTPAPVFGAQPTGPTEIGRVVNIVDGDTIDVVVDGVELRVRYIGMDTPEVHNGDEWLGPEASAANAQLVAGKEVVLEKDVSETDQYGRALRYVWVHEGSGWLLVNLELIRLGFASITTYPPDVKYVDAIYVPAQNEAQAAGLGLWAAPPPPVATPVPTAAPVVPLPFTSTCEPSYPDICIPVGTPDLDCPDMYAQGISMIRVRWDVVPADPHRFDGNSDGWGCEG